jgi:CRISPR/Cas system-associated exonuclease Cas4 (RecB family)
MINSDLSIARRSAVQLMPLGADVTAAAEAAPGEAMCLLRARGALSELLVRHAALPFRGVIDLLWLDGTAVVIVDFKTGQERDEHALQAICYALMWWRQTGVLPGRTEIRYPNRTQVVTLTEDRLRQTEDDLRGRIEKMTHALSDRPASPRPGEYCPQCGVRRFCDSYWADRTRLPSLPARGQKRAIDVEMVVNGVPTPAGFEASLADNRKVPVVFEEGCQAVFAPVAPGERLRVLGVQVDSSGAFELKVWTEVFHLPSSSGRVGVKTVS